MTCSSTIATTSLMHDDIERIAHAAKPGDGFLVAQGPATKPATARLESLIEQLQRHLANSAPPCGGFSRELGNLVVVRPGVRCCGVFRQAPAPDSVTVAGAPVPAEPGQMALFPARLQGVEVATDS